ncbi:MBL fold metallo-hydrolase [Thermodesulfobacteriota bacterium]
MEIEFKWIGGATWTLSVGGLKLACDPVLCPAGTVQDYVVFKSRRLTDPVFQDGDFDDVDLWLITHGHEDHLDQAGLARIKAGSKVVTHRNARRKLRRSGADEIIRLRRGESKTLKVAGAEVNVEAIPAVHGVNPLMALFAGGVNGYWVTVRGEEGLISLYATGDTVDNPRVMTALQGRAVDLLIPNMGAARPASWSGTITLSARMLRRFVDILRPKLTVPVHFGTFEHYVEPVAEILKLGEESVQILQPGETLTYRF